MKFPSQFVRYVGTVPAGGKALGSDSLPEGKASSSTDNALFCKFSNVNGWPVQRIAVVYTGPGETPPAVTATMYFYEDGTGEWYQIGSANVSMVSGTVTFFDVVALLDIPNTLANLQDALAGSITQVLIVNEPEGAASGEYSFAMAPDLTSQA